jgi:hypothetical protein
MTNRLIPLSEVMKDYDPSEPLPMSFDELIDEYHAAFDRADYAEFVLLVYHQLICLADLENLRAVEATALRTYPDPPNLNPNIRGGATWGQQPQATQRPDTDKTAYRHNHITNEKWWSMSYEEQTA